MNKIMNSPNGAKSGVPDGIPEIYRLKSIDFKQLISVYIRQDTTNSKLRYHGAGFTCRYR